jgi:hypothetical protein
MSITNDKIQNLKKEIEHIVFSDIGKADKVNKLWDFFIKHSKEISILSEVQNLLLKEITR